MKIRFLPIIMLLICIISSCTPRNEENRDEQEVQAVIDSFATHYYCWRFKDAARFSSPDFQQHLRYLSSNVHEADIKVLASSTASPEYSIDKIDLTSDSEAIVILKLRNIYQMDTLGTSAQLIDKATHQLLLEKENEKWEVKGLNEK